MRWPLSSHEPDIRNSHGGTVWEKAKDYCANTRRLVRRWRLLDWLPIDQLPAAVERHALKLINRDGASGTMGSTLALGEYLSD